MAPTPTSRIPFAPKPEYEVVWSGASTTFGEKGQLLPETHTVGSTWNACVDRLRKRIDGANKRDLDA